MRREELTPKEQRTILVGHVRNMLPDAGSVFTPWYGLDLSYKDGRLCRVTRAATQAQSFQPLATIEKILTMSDKEIWTLVTQEK